jgi:hypothetical protein
MQNVHATTWGLVQIMGHDASVPTTIATSNVQVDGVKSSDLNASKASITVGPDPVKFAAHGHGRECDQSGIECESA